ncbi:hypothetical protein ABT336_01455 [Micromonospora sp. NPDC000207]|uniref:hypothetical protein n=1 Tax=Micromonospora sp. NPDC000207 TaxID=3154246 RepID=UPI00331EC834
MSNADQLPVRLILDRSALCAYAAGSMHVAEPLHEVTEDGVRFGVPSVAAAEALASIADPTERSLLQALFGREACAMLSTSGEDWLELSYWRNLTGHLDCAAALVAAFEHDASLLTSDGKAYGDEGFLPVIYFPG